MRAILTGSRYPKALYDSVILRIRSEQDNTEKHIYKITRARAAIIKAYLLRNGNHEYIEEVATMALNEESNNLAYVLGRMFATLEAIQEDANPTINSTIKDRYFNSACATPAAIFPVLLKLSNSHLRKMEMKKQVYYEKLIGLLQNKIEMTEKPIPTQLTLEDQGIFILGYYHQTQKRFEKKSKEE